MDQEMLTRVAKQLFTALLLAIAGVAAVGQDQFGASAGGSDISLEERLVARLSSGDEEQKMDALVQLGALFSTAPGAISNTTISALTNSLQNDHSAVVRALAARALELSGDPRVVDFLLPALQKERQIAVRKAIIYALARYHLTRTPEAATSLILLSRDKNHEVRAAATYTLAEYADPGMKDALIEILQKRRQDEDAFARSQAARGLGRIASRDAMTSLLKALSDDKSGEVRRESAHALGNIATRQDLEVIDALRRATLSDDPYLTVAADNALAIINSRTGT